MPSDTILAGPLQASRHLRPRKQQVLTWAGRDKTSFEIAAILGLTKRTVDFHMGHARAKLGATTGVHAAAIAAFRHLIEL